MALCRACHEAIHIAFAHAREDHPSVTMRTVTNKVKKAYAVLGRLPGPTEVRFTERRRARNLVP